MLSFLKVAPQCCDAKDYVQFGIECANTNVCYGPLRPVGDYLWFSIPSRLGWPIESLITANLLLMFISVTLSVIAIRKIFPFICKSINSSPPPIFLIAILSLIVHAFFLRPTIFNTLSDPPANMFLFTAVWMLLIAHFDTGSIKKGVQFFIIGICLGLAAWLRAFYLYPVLAGIFVYIFIWIVSKNKVWQELLILIALLPIGLQYAVMHEVYGDNSYLKKEKTAGWINLHLNNPNSGYDTTFPHNGHYWQPQHCEAQFGIVNGFLNGEFKDVACVVAERIYFYLGTYKKETYIFPAVKNKLIGQYAESIGDESGDWFLNKMTWEPDVEMAPSSQKTADKLTITSPLPDGQGDIVQWVQLHGNTSYTFSVWLWSPFSKTINLVIKRDRDNELVALQKITLSAVPTRYSVTGVTPSDDVYDVNIGRAPYKDHAITFGTEPGDFLYAWGAQLEIGESATEYDGSAVASPESIRTWHVELLLLNITVFLIAIWRFIVHRSFWLSGKSGASVLVIFLAAAAEGVAIIPEQRFAIGFMIFFWLIATTFIFMQIKKILARFYRSA